MLYNMLFNTKLHFCGPLPGPTVALSLIEISPALLQAPLQGLCRLLPAGTSPLPPSATDTFLGWPLPKCHIQGLSSKTLLPLPAPGRVSAIAP